jgi:hypothetical protein
MLPDRVWDNAIAANSGVSLEDGFCQFMFKMKQQVVNLLDELRRTSAPFQDSVS